MDIEKLQKELEELKQEKRIHEVQDMLFEAFINMARSRDPQQMLTVTMQKSLDIAAEFSGAQKGSLFLLDENGVVTDSILIRDQLEGKKRSDIIGKVVDKGLAGWVKHNLKVGVIEDTKTDDRWINLPGQPYTVRSAMAVPVLRHDKLFGIITLMHAKPCSFNQSCIRVVTQAAEQMALVLENVKLYRKLEKSKQTIEKYSKALDDELQQGKKIQEAFLPCTMPLIENCEIAFYFNSALKLSGDFFDVFDLPDGHLGFVIADVSGKGAGASLFMALTKTLLHVFSGSLTVETLKEINTSQLEFDPEKSLEAVPMINNYLAMEHCGQSMFVTLFFGILNPSTGVLHYINAGHEPFILFDKNGIKNSLQPTGPALGVIEYSSYQKCRIQFHHNETIIGFTDGVTEARSENREFYTRKRLKNLIEREKTLAPSSLLKSIKKDLKEFTGSAPQSDDITILAINWKKE